MQPAQNRLRQPEPAPKRARRPKLLIPQTLKRAGAFNQRRVQTEASDARDAAGIPWELAVARKAGAVLERHYPGHPFELRVDARQGVLMLRLNPLMGLHWHVIHLSTLAGDPAFCAVIRAAGEILERYQMPRARFSLDHFLAARAEVPPWLLGRRGYVPG